MAFRLCNLTWLELLSTHQFTSVVVAVVLVELDKGLVHWVAVVVVLERPLLTVLVGSVVEVVV